MGDYLAGPNHVLPTGGTARFFSPLGVDDFLKRTSFVRFEPPKIRELGADVIRLAEVEGLTAHGTSIDLRLSYGDEEFLFASDQRHVDLWLSVTRSF